jgi:NAD(P)-dependent dehydrogenase (short-subunit alcohol dehydrogenase family)
VTAAINDVGDRAVACIGAVGPAETADALVAKAVSEFGRLDVMVTNAGVLRDGVIWKMTDEAFDAVIETHMRGTFTCARAAAVHMREQGEGGRIIVVGSPSGQNGNFGQSNYAAAKAGIVAFARTLSMELARAEIAVNALIPQGWSRMVETMPVYEPVVKLLAEGKPLPHSVRHDHWLGTPADPAPLVVFLSSDAAAGITGQAIGIGGDKVALWSHPEEIVTEYVDGGWNAQQIADVWEEKFAPKSQTSGLSLPPLNLEES